MGVQAYTDGLCVGDVCEVCLWETRMVSSTLAIVPFGADTLLFLKLRLAV